MSALGATDLLNDAITLKKYIRIERSPRQADRVDGFALAVGTKWALIAQTADGGYFDGLVAIRVKDVVAVALAEDESFEGRFARTQPEWPPTAPEVDLDRTGGLLVGLAGLAPLIGIEQEHRHKSPMTWIGALAEVRGGQFALHEVRPDATWHERPLIYRSKRVTKVVILNRYQVALSTIANDRPAPAQHTE
jgi:hypothetical protein